MNMFKTRIQESAKRKHSSLLCLRINDEENGPIMLDHISLAKTNTLAQASTMIKTLYIFMY